MKTYTYSEARQRLARLLDEARTEGQVQIRRRDGSTFLLQVVRPAESPLDVPGVKSRLLPGELVDLLRAERARSGDAIVAALSKRGAQQTSTRSRSTSGRAERKQPRPRRR